MEVINLIKQRAYAPKLATNKICFLNVKVNHARDTPFVTFNFISLLYFNLIVCSFSFSFFPYNF